MGRILGMARSPFDPADEGWEKTVFRQGDMLQRESVDELTSGADVAVHLAFVTSGSADETRDVNLVGSRNVFESAVAAGADRVIYASSAAAYGLHADNPAQLSEEDPRRPTGEHHYAAQKAAVEDLLAEACSGSATGPYVFRPSIVAGPQAPLRLDRLPN